MADKKEGSKDTSLANATDGMQKLKRVGKTPKKRPKKESMQKTVEVGAVLQAEKASKRKKSTRSLDVYDTKGKVVGSLPLPQPIFGATVNTHLIAQAIRVSLANQRGGTRSTKTRGEVTGSTRKIYRQKGTGRARHGGVRAPIFVHGGVAHGPKPRDFSLSLPKKMRRAALFGALSAKLASGNIKVVDGFEKLEAKTKAVEEALRNLGFDKKHPLLFILPSKHAEETDRLMRDRVIRSSRNLSYVSLKDAGMLSALEVLSHQNIVFLKTAVASLEAQFLKKE